jgi:hypothetical protein
LLEYGTYFDSHTSNKKQKVHNPYSSQQRATSIANAATAPPCETAAASATASNSLSLSAFPAEVQLAKCPDILVALCKRNDDLESVVAQHVSTIAALTNQKEKLKDHCLKEAMCLRPSTNARWSS